MYMHFRLHVSYHTQKLQAIDYSLAKILDLSPGHTKFFNAFKFSHAILKSLVSSKKSSIAVQQVPSLLHCWSSIAILHLYGMYTVKIIVQGLIIHFTSPLIFTPPRLTCPPTHIKMTLYWVSSSYEFHMSINREAACDIMDVDLYG